MTLVPVGFWRRFCAYIIDSIIMYVVYLFVENKIDLSGGADFYLDYDDKARFYFYKNKLDWILFTNVNKNYFDQLYKNYEGIKFSSDGKQFRYIYSQETSQIIKGEIIPDGSLYVYLTIAEPDFLENIGYLETEQSNSSLEEKKPEIKELEGLFYLYGVSLGEPQSAVIEQIGESYIIMDEEEMSRSDYVFEDEGKVQLYITNDKLSMLAVNNVFLVW